MPTLENDPPGIHTPAEVATVLEAARKIDINAMRCFAIRYFAGLRTSEAVNLQETEIGARFIEVTAAKSKTRRRRLVTVQPALSAWLALGGELPLRQVANRLRAVTLAAAVPWPHNATRHSFVTYHLAAFENAGKTALEAGHTEQILFNHYREIVKPEVAAAFWAIRPKPTA
jgi:integrase